MSKTTTTMPYFKFDSGRFLAETRGLPLASIGTYALMQALYWEAGCRLPSKDVLKRQLGVRTEDDHRHFDEVLESFFPDGLHPHLDLCLDEAKQFSKEQSEKARKGWEKRKAVTPTPQQGIPGEAIPEDDPDF